MDEIVRQAMAKWPNVPHCFGWLRLDARGGWRMRDERAQHLNLPGERITHPALLAFIERNYGRDELGRCYFQNGPQRVYVDLELAPYIVRTMPDADAPAGLRLQFHTGERVAQVDSAWLDESGRLYLRDGDKIGALDDRDMAQLLPMLQANGHHDEDALMRWMDGDDGIELRLAHGAPSVAVQRLPGDTAAQRFGFVTTPRAADDAPEKTD